jgi:hypothetical protein
MELLFHSNTRHIHPFTLSVQLVTKHIHFSSPILFYAFVTVQQSGLTVILGALHKRGSLASHV